MLFVGKDPIGNSESRGVDAADAKMGDRTLFSPRWSVEHPLIFNLLGPFVNIEV
jgi:hypothetical protein